MKNYRLMNLFNKKVTIVFKKSIIFIALSLSCLFQVSCTKENNDSPLIIEGTAIANFSLLRADNPSILTDVFLDKEENVISGRVPHNSTISQLIPSFVHNGSTVEVNNIPQISGKTPNDFTNEVTYTVKTSEGIKENYTVDVTYFTGLPIVYINTNGVAINSKEETIEGVASIYGGRNHEFLDETKMEIRGRGNSTWWIHPKKPYQLKFNDKTEMLNMPKDKKWIFLAEYSDKTLLRNKIAFELGYLSSLAWTPKSEFAEVFVNNIYSGTYNISQKVEESSNRVNLGDTGYLLEIDQLDRLDPDDVFFRTNNFLINIKEPSLSYESSEYSYIKNLLNEFENVLKSNQFKDANSGYAKYIDIDSFIDWYLINEITKNQDSKDFSSIFLNVIPGEKIKMGPIWDFDLAFGNVNYSDATHPEGYWVKEHKWFARLFEDPVFVNKVKSRFSYYKQNQNFIINKIDSYANYLKWSKTENNNKWNLFGNYVWPNPVFFNTYEEEVSHLKKWYITRMNWLESAYNKL